MNSQGCRPAANATGFVYDPVFLKHNQPGHPEGAYRLEAIWQAVQDSGLLAELHQVPARPATKEELTSIHPAGYIDRVAAVCRRGGGMLDMDTYVTPATFDAALMAAGGLIDLTLAVSSGQLRNGFAMIRPPGHHATRNSSMGFCIFNNVALAARAAQDTGKISRLAVVDFDVHHGNGTQDALASDPDIFFVSTHQFPHFPGTGRYQERGSGAGEGATVNFPLPAGVGDAGFKALYEQVLIPVLRKFAPELILVSAGYDTHWQDPLAGLCLSCQGQAWLSQTLVALADEQCEGRIVFSLEGGYEVKVLGHGVTNSLRALMGRKNFEDSLGPAPHPEPDLREYIDLVKKDLL